MKNYDTPGKALTKTFLTFFFILFSSIVFSSGAIAGLVDLDGSAPEEASMTVVVDKPANAVIGHILLSAFDADQLNEGELIINGNPPIVLFGEAGVSSNDAKSSYVFLKSPATYWRDGNNTLLFKHTKTGGYVIDDVRVQFEVSKEPEPTPTPDANTFPLDLEGSAPEEATITISVNKPSNATKGYITLDVYDADFSDEGELIINGNKAIVLFGSAGTSANDIKSASITFSTPASYWKDGNNTLRFKHTRTAGFVINDVAVRFDVDTSSNSDPAPEPEPTPTPDANIFPIDLEGSAPEEATITISVNKPSNATKGYITLNVYDADFSDEGELIINGNKAIVLFGSAGTSANDIKSVSITFSTPASYWKDGNNTLRFKHTRTAGFVINDVTVQFDSSDGQAGSGSVNLSWVAPVERIDNSALAVNEIAGYTIHYGTSQGDYPNALSINDNYASTATINNLQSGTYYMVISTRDTGGRESEYSSVVTKQVP